jgi:ureidoglycolate lyase
MFIALGQEPFIMVMAPPKTLPDLDKVQALRFPPGHGLLLHRGTWHAFPLACERPVVVLTANSDEVVEALASRTTAQDQGDPCASG